MAASRSCRLLLTTIAGLSAAASTLPADAPQVPDGFTVERVAGPEHVQHPMMACFDDVGRLYVCESAGTNRKAAELIADPQDSIKVLEDVDGDGAYDKSWTFADKLVFPQGCLWYRGSIYTCSSPYLWKLTDTDGDGVCDQREVLVKSFGFSGNAADIHGPFLSPDGRLYWCDGRHGHEIRDLGDGEVGGADDVTSVTPDPEPGLPHSGDGELLTQGKAARIFSCRPDGTDLRVLCGGGMDNPVELDFWETGECLGSVNLFYGRPRGDCLVHWVEGGVYPRTDMPHCTEEFPWTGGLLGPVTNYGHVAVSGLCRYRSDQFDTPDAPLAGDAGREELAAATSALESPTSLYDRGVFFVTQFNTHKVVKTVVARDGSTFRALETSDFLVSDDPDFHPTDVLEDADGSLLVIDTGGWFRIGCPTSQVAKPEIAGGIYRIRRTGSHQVDDPRGLVINWPEVTADAKRLRELLSDPRPVVREKGIDAAAVAMDAQEDFVPNLCIAVHEAGVPRQVRGFARAMGRTSRNPITTHYIEEDQDPADRIAAILALPWHQLEADEASRDSAITGLYKSTLSDHPAEARAATEALGRILAGRAAEAAYYKLMEDVRDRLARPDVDRMLEHASIMALTRVGDRNVARECLASEHATVQRAGLIALDQMHDGDLTRDEVLPLLAATDSRLQEAVLEVISHRDGWNGEALALFRDWLKSDISNDQADVLRRFLSAQAHDPSVQTFMAESVVDASRSVASRAVILESMASAEVSDWPEAWTPVLASLLSTDDANLKLSALQIIGSRGRTEFDADLQRLFTGDDQPHAVRIEALAALGQRREQIQDQERRFISEFLRSDADLLLRLRMASAYASGPCSPVHTCTINGLTRRLGPTFVPAFWPAYQQAESPTRQRYIVAALSEFDDLPGVSDQQLRDLLVKYSPEAQAEAAPLLEKLVARRAAEAEKIDRYLPLADGGDANRGRYIFFGQTAACSRCHRVADEGAQIGPDLTKIATIRQPRDLVEAILLPSASFARDYHPYTAVTTDGRVVNGLITRQSSDTVVFRQTDLSEVRLPRAQIELLKESETSIMPQGLETKLSDQEFRDLLAYLQGLK
ncbi:MAG: c-type cytochrome [Planctomycetaceae bacterium]|nr:c-type cytochrome [Planctomycetaceae bacterium]